MTEMLSPTPCQHCRETSIRIQMLEQQRDQLLAQNQALVSLAQALGQSRLRGWTGQPNGHLTNSDDINQTLETGSLRKAEKSSSRSQSEAPVAAMPSVLPDPSSSLQGSASDMERVLVSASQTLDSSLEHLKSVGLTVVWFRDKNHHRIPTRCRLVYLPSPKDSLRPGQLVISTDGEPDFFLSLLRIGDIYLGKQSAAFRRHICKSIPDECCLSLASRQGVGFSFQCLGADDRDLLVSGILVALHRDPDAAPARIHRMPVFLNPPTLPYSMRPGQSSDMEISVSVSCRRLPVMTPFTRRHRPLVRLFNDDATISSSRYMDPLVQVFRQDAVSGRLYFLQQSAPVDAPDRNSRKECRRNPVFPERVVISVPQDGEGGVEERLAEEDEERKEDAGSPQLNGKLLQPGGEQTAYAFVVTFHPNSRKLKFKYRLGWATVSLAQLLEAARNGTTLVLPLQNPLKKSFSRMLMERASEICITPVLNHFQALPESMSVSVGAPITPRRGASLPHEAAPSRRPTSQNPSPASQHFRIGTLSDGDFPATQSALTSDSLSDQCATESLLNSGDLSDLLGTLSQSTLVVVQRREGQPFQARLEYVHNEQQVQLSHINLVSENGDETSRIPVLSIARLSKAGPTNLLSITLDPDADGHYGSPDLVVSFSTHKVRNLWLRGLATVRRAIDRLVSSQFAQDSNNNATVGFGE